MLPVLRVCTSGSVDDGKSTLIGRLLFDTKSILVDQLAAVEEASQRRGFARTDLALLTDGLRAEREQGITIDVAFRYFATAHRRFVLADTPGHVQYTRNMVTGASVSDVLLLVVDVRNGLVEQTLRHLSVADLLGIRHVVICVNKMDQVDYAERRFNQVREAVLAYGRSLSLPPPLFIPISALLGDNVVTRSQRMPFYDGPALLAHLERVVPDVAPDREPMRFPVQWVIRPHADDLHDYRAYVGRVASGVIRTGDAVRALPAGQTTRVRALDVAGATVTEARRGESVSVQLDHDLDLGRGDTLTSMGDATPSVSRGVVADLFWLVSRPARVGAKYLLKQGHTTTRALVQRIHHRLNLVERTEVPAEGIGINEFARVTLRTADPLVWEPYATSRRLGSAILIDESTKETVSAVILREEAVG